MDVKRQGLLSFDRTKKIGIPLICALLFVMSIIQFNWAMNVNTRNSTYEILQETASTYIHKINSHLDNQYVILEGMADYMCTFYKEDIRSPQIRNIMAAYVNKSEIYRISVSDRDGVTVNDDGEESNARDFDFFKQAMEGKRYIEKVSVDPFEEREEFLIAVPIFYEGKVIGVVSGSYNIDVFSEMLVTDFYGGEAFVFIGDKDGNIICKSKNKNFLHNSGNVFDTYVQSKFSDDVTVETMKRDFENKGRNTVLVSYDGEQRYLSYSPLGINNWIIFSVVPETVVSNQRKYIVNFGLLLSAELLAIFGLLLFYVVTSDKHKQYEIEKEKERLKLSEKKYRMLENLGDSVVFEVDHENDTIHFNENYKKIIGSIPPSNSFSQFMEQGCNILEEDRDELTRTITFLEEKKATNAFCEVRVITLAGVVWCKIEIVVIRYRNGEIDRIIGKITNINKMKSKMEQLVLQAETDSLTKVLNHQSLEKRVNEFLTSDGADGTHAFIILDIDDFKSINDTYGHFNGDMVLTSITEMLKEHLRSTDMLGRIGGDEFVVLIKNIGDRDAIIHKSSEFINGMHKLNMGQDNNIQGSISMGISLYSKDGRSFEELYKKADIALYQAKNKGKQGFVIFGDNPDL